MATARKPPPGAPPVDLQAMENHRRLLEAQDAVASGRVPFVHPSVTNPQAIGAAIGMAARAQQRGQGLPERVRANLPSKYTSAVAGGPPPPMPALEAQAAHGATMAAQASATRADGDHQATRQAVSAHAARPGSIIQDGGSVPQQPGRAQPEPPLLLHPSDMLPEEATRDPAFQQGAGSMLAQLQPHLARRYGVVRGGQRIAPQALQGPPAQGQLRGAQEGPQDFRQRTRSRAEIGRDLEAAGTALRTHQGQPPRPPPADPGEPPPPADLPSSDEEAEEQAARGPGGAAARSGGVADDTVVRAALDNMGDLDFEALRLEMMKDILKNPRQREIVEKRMKPLGATDFDHLLATNSIRQRVPIIPGVFEPTFESMDQSVEFELKQLLMLESKSVNVTDAYLLDKYSVMTTTAGVVAINNNPLPGMYDSNGDFNADLFWRKYQWMIKKPLHMLASLGIHYAWFEGRVRKLFEVTEVKNG